MQAVELHLFSIDTPQQNVLNPVKKITEDQLISPLGEVLDKVIQPAHQSLDNSRPIIQSLNELFPEQQYEDKDIQKTKQVLGEVISQFSPEELKTAMTEVQYLVETWVDDFEREIFEGKTLRELLHEKGSL